MTSLQNKIETFYKKRNKTFRKPLEKIINYMLNKCRYINNESLERHNWGEPPLKLKFIPTNINSPSFESELLDALSLNENEKSTIELLWGDIQLGKRVQACIIMWISVYILKRPVLYIFRNLSIDQKQLQDDIVGTENYNFNIQFIKNLFEEFNNELQEHFEEKNVDYWKDYKLPELKDINSNDIINKLSNKEAINSNDIFCCLMNHAQLEKINKKFSEYISYNKELVNMSVLVDESDLMSPTSSNDRSNNNDIKDTTMCEILLAKIYKKVKYVLHITGTAHSLLYNITTRLSHNHDIQIKISKVHKMKRSSNYYGLFSNSIIFNTEEEKNDYELTAEEKQNKYKYGTLITKPVINSWWKPTDDNVKQKNDNVKQKNDNVKQKYDIVEDYNINIKKIIENIIKRENVKYNSLLISEEKIRINQFSLVFKILNDFPDLFIVIYHGNCLRLYLSKVYEKEIKCWSQWDSKESSTSQRLWQNGGVYGSSIDTEKSEKLPNNYCYFNINTKILNIKFIYKLLRILFEKSEIHIKNKTTITITGKYGERGYSFTSDDYDKYSFHLTDQYFVSHASFNCTDISQRLRLQGKYNDNELKNGNMKLTLWTTIKLQDIIQNFYVKFIKEIEKFIMDCESWENIKDLIESIIDNGEFKFEKYMQYIDVCKKRRNIHIQKHFDKKNNGYKLILVDDMNNDEIAKWCKEKNLPDYLCVNEIKEMKKDECNFNKIKIAGVPLKINLPNVDELNKKKLKKKNKLLFLSQITKYLPTGFNKKNLVNKRMIGENNEKYEILNIKEHIQENKPKNPDKNCKYLNDYNLLIITNDIPEFECKKGDCFITFYTNNYNIINKNIGSNNPFKNDNIFITDNEIIKYSVIKEEYKQQNTDNDEIIENECLPRKYYWKTPDGWLYLFNSDNPNIISLNITCPCEKPSNISPEIDHVIPSKISLINEDVKLFINKCCKITDKPNLRFGIKEIYLIYETWCKLNKKECLITQKKLKEELRKFNYKELKSKGVNINNKPGKRGYNIMVAL